MSRGQCIPPSALATCKWLSWRITTDIAQGLVRRSLAEGAAIELVVGEEISTLDGHLLGIDLRMLVPAGLSLADSIAAVHEQGGLAVVAHPLLPSRISAPAHLLHELAQGDPRRRPDGLEAMNSMAAWVPGWRRRVEALAAHCGYALTGGSDTHLARSVGRCYTCFAGSTASELLGSLRGRATAGEGRRHPLRDIVQGVASQLVSGAVVLRR